MRLYLTRKQCEQVIIALMKTYGSRDIDSLKTISLINKTLLLQCERDKSHYDEDNDQDNN